MLRYQAFVMRLYGPLLGALWAWGGCATAPPARLPEPSASAAARPRKAPNVIFIMADDLGYGHLGSYGQTRIETPHLDRMAAEGMRFTQYYAGSTVCAPSRSVLMTGLHTGHTSVRDNSGAVPLLDEDITLAERLRPLGYKTALYGKWGLGDVGSAGVPWQQGFDEFFGYLHQVHAHYYYPAFLWHKAEKVAFPENADDRKGRYAHDAIMDEALAWLERNHERPFFLYLPVTIPHTELQAPEDALAAYAGRFPEPTPFVGTHHLAPQPRPRTALAAMISRLDRDVGRLLALLRRLGLAEDTVVFFTSDNGASDDMSDATFFAANGPLRGHKRELYEGGIRVPLIVWGPSRIPKGRVSAHVFAAWDVLPTLVDLAGGEVPVGIDGVSVLPTLTGGTQAEMPFLYWEAGGERKLAQAVRHGSWKGLRVEPGAPLRLFDLRVDLAEAHDVSAQHPEVVETLESFLRQARRPPRPYPPTLPLYDYERKATGFVN